ncbi:MAG: V-type ATP synthase subunit E [Ruminococcus sp.]|nr:V-type ATP synthase subunit E [Ruminococcus sp.]
MNGGEKILNRIKADCDEKVNEILQKSNEECSKILSQAEIQAEKSSKAITEKTTSKLTQIKNSSKSRAELEIRNALLRKRRNEIDKTIDEVEKYLLGLNDEEYFSFIYKLAENLKGKTGEVFLNNNDLRRLPSDFETKINSLGLDVTVSNKSVDIVGGFILKSGDIEENMAIDALIMSKRDALEDMINRELFK